MPGLTRRRRFALASISLAMSTLLFRSDIAQGLVVRGDDYVYRNDSGEAMIRYERALSIDPDNGPAVDRMVFLRMEQRTPASLAQGDAIATRYLRTHPRDPAVLADRALCRLIQRRYNAAQPDFQRAAEITRDPRYFTFAGWAALRARDRLAARRLWRAALAVDARFAPARDALERGL